MRALRFGAHIVVGTPGRVIDHLDRKTLQLDQVKFAVLDEADEMLDMGFRDDIETILKKTPSERQTALFSATMPTEIRNLAKEYQKNPEIVNLVVKDATRPLIEQIYYEVPNPRKSDLLASLLDIDQPALSIAFCNTIQRVDELTRKLQEAGYSADSLHGDMRQSRRDRGDCKILVATDVAARGIDVAGIDVVFNVDLPLDQENYVHRIGRTGRAGRTGKAYSFVGGRDRMLLKTIARNANGTLEQRQVPSQEVVEASRAEKIFTKIATDTKPESHLEKYITLIKTNLGEVGDPVKLAASLLKTIIHKGKPIQTDFSHSDDSRREGREGGRRSFGNREDRPERSFGPRRSFGNREDRPERSFGNREDRPERSFGNREDRPFRGEGRPFTPRSDFGDKRSDFGDKRSGGDRPRRSFDDKGSSFGNREFPRREGGSRFEGGDSFGGGRGNWKKNDDHGSQARFGSRRPSEFSSRRNQA
jgi:ATP-dependent RNA helicase DeaD